MVFCSLKFWVSQKFTLGFSIKCDRKIRMKFLADPVIRITGHIWSAPGRMFHCPCSSSYLLLSSLHGTLVAQMVKNLPAMKETWVRSAGREDPLEEGMATHSSILAWRVPWTEEPGGLQSMESKRAGHDWPSNIPLLPYVFSCLSLKHFDVQKRRNGSYSK